MEMPLKQHPGRCVRGQKGSSPRPPRVVSERLWTRPASRTPRVSGRASVRIRPMLGKLTLGTGRRTGLQKRETDVKTEGRHRSGKSGLRLAREKRQKPPRLQ